MLGFLKISFLIIFQKYLFIYFSWNSGDKWFEAWLKVKISKNISEPNDI